MSNPLQKRAAWLAASLAVIAALLPSARGAATDSSAAAPASTAGSASAKPDAKPATDTPPTPAEEKAYLENFGWILGLKGGIYELGLTPAEIDQVAAGMKNATKLSDPPPRDVLMKMSSYLSGRAEKVHDAADAAEKKFFADLEAKKIKKSDSGLYYEIIDPGTGAKPKDSDHVTVAYVGTLPDGSVFDQTKAGDPPADFDLNKVIPGWTEGLQLIGKGGKIKLYVPSKLGYGEDGQLPRIPPMSPLIFTVDLKDVGPAAKPNAIDPALLDALQKMNPAPAAGK